MKAITAPRPFHPAVYHPSPRRTWRQAVACAAALAALAAASSATLAAAPAHASTTDHCLTVDAPGSYWNAGPDSGGVIRSITITNTCTTTAVTGWTLALVLPTGHTFQHGWSAAWALDGEVLTATPESWNATIGAGRLISIGYTGTWAGSRQDPDCTINGGPCAKQPGQPGDGPTVTLTGPTANSAVVSVCRVRMTADAQTAVGTIDRVEFYINGTLVGSDSSGPYEIDVPPTHPAFRDGASGGGYPQHTAFARVVTVAPAATADSALISFSQAAMPPALMVVACPSRVQVTEGGSTTMTFVSVCSATPGLTLTVSGDPRISVTPTAFPPGNREHHVTVSASPGSVGAVARIQATADSGCLPASAEVTVVP